MIAQEKQQIIGVSREFGMENARESSIFGLVSQHN
jgi:hypothetical protein